MASSVLHVLFPYNCIKFLKLRHQTAGDRKGAERNAAPAAKDGTPARENGRRETASPVLSDFKAQWMTTPWPRALTYFASSVTSDTVILPSALPSTLPEPGTRVTS